MKDLALDRLLSRYEFGKLAPELLEIELRTTLQELADRIGALAQRTETIRLWNSELLKARDDAFTRAGRAVSMLRFREAIRQIHRCREVITAMARLLEAVDRADRADESMNAVWTLAETARLRSLPSVASLGQIIDVARSMIVEQGYLRAAHTADIGRRLAQSFAQREALQSDQRIAMQTRLRDIEALCAATRPFAESPDDDPARDGTLAALRGLLQRDYVRLGLRLLAELEIQMAGRRRFFDFCIRRGNGRFAARELEQLCLSVRERSWDGAVDEQWHRSIAGYSNVIGEQRQRVNAAVVALEGTLAPVNEQITEIA